MADQTIRMNVGNTLEIDLSVQEMSSSSISFNKNPSGKSDAYISKNIYIFNPNGSGTYELEIDGQIIEIEVIDIPQGVIDNFEAASSDPVGPYESGETLSDYYTGYGGLGQFSRTTKDAVDGSKAIEMISTDTTDAFAVSEPGDGLPVYPQQSDTVGFLSRENGGTYGGVLWGSGGTNGFDGYGFEMNGETSELRIYKWTDSGSRSLLSSTPISISDYTWYWMESDMPDSSGDMSVRLYELDTSDLSRGSQIGSELTVSDTDHNDKRGIGFYNRGNNTGTFFDWMRVLQ
jgi:hypothetical protein